MKHILLQQQTSTSVRCIVPTCSFTPEFDSWTRASSRFRSRYLLSPQPQHSLEEARRRRKLQCRQRLLRFRHTVFLRIRRGLAAELETIIQRMLRLHDDHQVRWISGLALSRGSTPPLHRVVTLVCPSCSWSPATQACYAAVIALNVQLGDAMGKWLVAQQETRHAGLQPVEPFPLPRFSCTMRSTLEESSVRDQTAPHSQNGCAPPTTCSQVPMLIV